MFEKRQWLGLGAILGGACMLLPVAFAMKGEDKKLQENDPMIQQLQRGQVQRGEGIITGSNGKVTTVKDNSRFDNEQTITNQPSYNSNNTSFGPAASGDKMRPQDYAPAGLKQTTTNYTQPQTTNYATTQGMTCEYYAPAGNAGFYHFRFPEARSSDLVTVNGYKVHRMAADQLKKMISDARSQGVTLTIGSAFRSVEYQRGIVQRKKAAGQSISKIYYVSSHPGFSEHHTGLAIDFTPINHSFAKSAGYRWLQNNAHKYGFEKTFTAEYSRATGISEESWHWKYTGTAEARAMLANGKCYQKPKSQWKGVNN